MTPDELKELMLSMLRNKEQILETLLAGIAEMDRMQDGIKRVVGSIENGSDANLRKQVKNLMAGQARMSESMKPMLLLMFLYASSEDLDKSASMLAMKLGGDAKEILHQTIRNKFGGRNPFDGGGQ